MDIFKLSEWLKFIESKKRLFDIEDKIDRLTRELKTWLSTENNKGGSR